MKLNGNLLLNNNGQSEIQNLTIERLATAPVGATLAYAGRVYYNTTDNITYYHNGTVWMALATGGNATALQTEVDAIEASLGTAVSTDGTFNAAAFTSGNSTVWTSPPASVTDAIITLASYEGAHDALAELKDVTLTGLADKQYLKYDATAASGAGRWVNETLILADVSDVTATYTEVNQLHGATFVAADLNKLAAITVSAAQINNVGATTASTSELNTLVGVTSAIQTQLNGKQPLDATLTALAALHGAGLVVETSQDVFTNRSLIAPAAGITITNADAIAGNPTFALANDLAGLEGLTGTGFAVRTGDGTWTTDSIMSGSADRIVVTNGSGVSTSPTIDLATVTNSATGTFQKLSSDGYGRVTGTTAVVQSDITTLVDSVYVNAAGDSMTGNLSMGGFEVTGLPSVPGGDTAATSKAYVDAAVAGLTWKNSVAVASTAAGTLASSFTAGTVVDGYTLVLGDRILIKDQAVSTENGIYIVTAGAPTRSTDADTGVELDHATVFVEHGTAQAATGWTVNNATTPALTGGTNGPNFVQFNGASSVIAGVGLSKTGNQIDVNLGAGIAQLPSDEVGIDLWTSINALRLTTDGSTASTATNAQLTLVLKSAGGLTQDTNGLYVPAGGITNAMLANSSITIDVDGGGTAALSLGDTLVYDGNSAQGVSTNVATAGLTKTVGITVADASASQKGVASFDATEFTITTGNVVLGTIANGKLANSLINFQGSDTSTDAVSLGETVQFLDGGSHAGLPLVLSSVAANHVTLKVREATTTALGVASFNGAQFAVTAGAVSLNATLADLLNVDPAVDVSPTAGDLLQNDGTKWNKISGTALFGGTSIDALSDVTLTSPATGQTLVYSSGQFVNKPLYFKYVAGAAGTSHTVTHNLGQQFCNVTVFDSATNEVVIPQSIVCGSTSACTVTFNSALSCTVVVMGIA